MFEINELFHINNDTDKRFPVPEKHGQLKSRKYIQLKPRLLLFDQ